jgi:hypothetical protein
MPDRDLLEIFDAALPRLREYGQGSVPKAGSHELAVYEYRRRGARENFGIGAAFFGLFGGLALYVASIPLMPVWFLGILVAASATGGVAAMHQFLKLAAVRHPQQALPEGTDVATARLEDGTWKLICRWNADVRVWHKAVDDLRLEVSGWHVLRNFPDARDVEWTEHGSKIQADGLIAAIEGLAADRAALVARKEEIEHRLRSLDTRLAQLKASEEAPVRALPPPSEDPADDG